MLAAGGGAVLRRSLSFMLMMPHHLDQFGMRWGCDRDLASDDADADADAHDTAVSL